MKIETNTPVETVKQQPKVESTLIEVDDIKAILALGIRGEISIDSEEHKVDTEA
jgi:CheY-specific phosphatase CheX